ncbi:MAG: hypothetical protein VZQ83_03080 [Eubacterium sp.]|nr:hypothetical protein [Eubacterium sp.]
MRKKLLSIVLVLAMAASLLPVQSQAKTEPVEAHVAELPPEVEGGAEAAETFAHAVCSICESVEMSGLTQAIMAGGGITMAISGCVAILKVCGVIEDPTEKKLAQIMDGISDINKELQNMDEKLNTISQQILDLAVSQEEKDRVNKALSYLSSWNLFKSAYITKLSEKTAAYSGKIELATKTWWGEDKHDPVKVLYATNEDKLIQAVSNSTDTTLPDTSDNGSTVEKDSSFIVPADVMPATKSETFSINTYKDRFKALASAAILSAANAKKLIATDGFYTAWAALSDADKKAKADQYGEDLFNAVIYNVSCKQMTDDHVWVKELADNYSTFASEMVSGSNGAIQLINAQKNMNAFEGEIKDEIQYIINSMITTAGVYGQLALNAAAQDSMMTDDAKKTLQKTWIDTITTLDKIGSGSLTGNDNYCYITGGVIQCQNATVKSDGHFYYLENGSHRIYKDAWWNDWYAEDGDKKSTDLKQAHMVNETFSRVIYDNYIGKNALAADADKATFKDYLNKFGVGFPDSYNDTLTTGYTGQKGFTLSENVNLTAQVIIGDHYTTGSSYTLSGDSNLFPLHDCIKYNYMNTSNGGVTTDARLCSRGYYEEDHWYWKVDEMTFFYAGGEFVNGGCKPCGHINGLQQYKATYQIKAPVYYLSSTAPAKASDTPDAITDPSNHMVIVPIDGTAVLQKTDLPYTGKAQKPIVETIQGASVSEGHDYKIKVNKTAKAIGTYKATITGIGNYTGTQTVTFRIVKADNPLKAAGLEKTIKAKKLKKKAMKMKTAEHLWMKKGAGKITYTLSKTSPAKSKKFFKINKKTGVLTIKKGLKAGQYGLFIKVKAAGNKTTKAATKTIETLITVK